MRTFVTIGLTIVSLLLNTYSLVSSDWTYFSVNLAVSILAILCLQDLQTQREREGMRIEQRERKEAYQQAQGTDCQVFHARSELMRHWKENRI